MAWGDTEDGGADGDGGDGEGGGRETTEGGRGGFLGAEEVLLRDFEGKSESRDVLVYFVFIDGPREVLMERIEMREGRFMKAAMVASQLAAMESPVREDGVADVPLTDKPRIAVDNIESEVGCDLQLSGTTCSKRIRVSRYKGRWH